MGTTQRQGAVTNCSGVGSAKEQEWTVWSEPLPNPCSRWGARSSKALHFFVGFQRRNATLLIRFGPTLTEGGGIASPRAHKF